MRILNDETVLEFLDLQNNRVTPKMSTMQLQAHLDFPCGCKITQDNKGNSLFPCETHAKWARINADNKTLHSVLH